MKRTFHLSTWLCTIALASASAAELGGKLEPMFEQHCYDCHDADAKKGGLDLTALKWQPDDIENLQQWTKVFDKVERGEMPPKKKGRPAAELSHAFLKTLRGELQGYSRRLK
jgi:mono/diheme cytochrome c family protein